MSMGAGYINILNDTRTSMASAALARNQAGVATQEKIEKQQKNKEDKETAESRVAKKKAENKNTALVNDMSTESLEAVRETGGHVESALQQQELQKLQRERTKQFELYQKASVSEQGWEAVRGYMAAGGASEEELNKMFGESWNQGKMQGYAARAAEDAEQVNKIENTRAVGENSIDVALIQSAAQIKAANIAAESRIRSAVAGARSSGRKPTEAEVRGGFTIPNTVDMVRAIGVNSGIISPADVKAKDGKGTPEANAMIHEINTLAHDTFTRKINKYLNEYDAWAMGGAGAPPEIPSFRESLGVATDRVRQAQEQHKSNYGNWLWGLGDEDTPGTTNTTTKSERNTAKDRKFFADMKAKFPDMPQQEMEAVLGYIKRIKYNLYDQPPLGAPQ